MKSGYRLSARDHQGIASDLGVQLHPFQLLPTQEVVEKWMQVRDQGVNVYQNVDLESSVIAPENGVKCLMQEAFLPPQNEQFICLPRDIIRLQKF